MKFAICNETFPDWSFEKACSFAGECGYTGLEIAPFTLAKYATEVPAARRSELKKIASDSGLEIIGLHWLLAQTEGFYLTSPDAAVRNRTADYFKALVELCSDLGGRVMVLGSPKQRNLLPGVSHEDGMSYAAETLRQVVPLLEERAITLALEPLGPEEGDFMRTADLGEQLMALVDSPNCRLHLDVKAMSTEPTPVCDILRKHAKNVAHFHANDPNRRGPGMGEVDFRPIFKTLQEINYTGWVSVEVFDYSPGPERLALESIQYMRRVLAELEA
jgi:sugar phosphate isomerase/epimerase